MQHILYTKGEKERDKKEGESERLRRERGKKRKTESDQDREREDNGKVCLRNRKSGVTNTATSFFHMMSVSSSERIHISQTEIS